MPFTKSLILLTNEGINQKIFGVKPHRLDPILITVYGRLWLKLLVYTSGKQIYLYQIFSILMPSYLVIKAVNDFYEKKSKKNIHIVGAGKLSCMIFPELASRLIQCISRNVCMFVSLGWLETSSWKPIALIAKLSLYFSKLWLFALF